MVTKLGIEAVLFRGRDNSAELLAEKLNGLFSASGVQAQATVRDAIHVDVVSNGVTKTLEHRSSPEDDADIPPGGWWALDEFVTPGRVAEYLAEWLPS